MFLLHHLFCVAFVYARYFEGLVPKGTCWIATPLHTASGPLGEPLISPVSPNYQDVLQAFIKPMMESIPKEFDIVQLKKKEKEREEEKEKQRSQEDSAGQDDKPDYQEEYSQEEDSEEEGSEERRRLPEENDKEEGNDEQARAKEYNEMLENVKVYYVDTGLDPMKTDENKLGLWSVKFGQFVFEFEDAESSVLPHRIVFNGLLPAIGIPDINKMTNLPKTWGIVVSGDDERDSKFERSRFSVWVVHQDPDPTSAYFVSVSEDKDRAVSSRWEAKKQFCGHKKSEDYTHSVRKYGNCDDVKIRIESHIKDNFNADNFEFNDRCTKIVLCSGGAFQFQFKTKGRLWRGDPELYVFAAKVSERCTHKCGPRQIATVKIHHSGHERCPELSTALDFKCRSRMKFRKNKEDQQRFGNHPFEISNAFASRYNWTYRVLPPQTIDEPGDYKCDTKRGMTLNRPRFQFKTKRDTIKTCCVKSILSAKKSLPVAKFEFSHWREIIEDEEDDEDDQEREFSHKRDSERGENDEDDEEDDNGNSGRGRAAVRQAIARCDEHVGKKPSDPTLTKLQRASITGHREMKGWNELPVWETLITAEECKELIESERAPENLDDPDDLLSHSPTPSRYYSYIAIIPAVIMTIAASFFMLLNQ